MGVLDDAIREHLELKRRHGATDDEIARQEAEALTPARRGPAAEPESGADAEPEAGADAEPAAAEAPPAEPPPAEEPPVEDPPVEPPPVEEPPVEDPQPPPAHGSTVEIPAAELPDAEPTVNADAGEEDVLEETPEFLRETPEHDRLWFEQKPPRDFDLED